MPNNAEIGELGCTTPIRIDAGNGVIVGHGRLQAAEQRGVEEVPVVRLAHPNPERARACGVADSRLTELGRWEHGLRSAELEALRAVDLDLELAGRDWKALAYLLPAAVARARLTAKANSTNGRAGPRDVRLTDMQTAREPARDGEPASAGGYGGGADWLDGGAERPGKKGATHASPLHPLGPPVKAKGTRVITAPGFPMCCRDDMSSRQIVNVLTPRHGGGGKWFTLRGSEGDSPSLCKPDMVYTLDRSHGLHADAPEKVGATHASPYARPRRPLLIPSASGARASIVHICIFIRGEFAAPKWPSKG